MRRSITYHPAVKEDLRQAHDWYEGSRDGLGDEFLIEIERVIGFIGDHPEIYESVQGNVRRGVTRRFPYIVLYRAEPQRIVILGVFHGSRDPVIWDERM